MIVRKSLLLFGIALLLATPVSASFGKVQAITANDWKAGRIIDDNIFTNANDMSVADIQAFLNSKVPVCDSNGQKSVGYYYNASTGQPKFSWFSGGAWVTTTRAVFAQRYSAYYQTNISNLPLTCLKNYYEVPKTAPGPGLPASNAFGAPIPAGAVSAAQMIYNASTKHNINPKVLLVKLHTESAGPLTTDDWPFQNQYLYAMGAHCPDSGPGGSANCDSNYAGFSIQMDEAAALLRWYLDSMTQSWWQYKKPYQTNSILWNVAPSGCGAGDVYIETKATAALYTYTPYQPNAAALANMYGTGDGCSAYGNRNFWRVYSDWFGSTVSGAKLSPLFKSSDTHQIFVVYGTTKYPFSSPEVMQSFGLSRSPITIVTSAYLDNNYITGPTIAFSLAKKMYDPSGTIYFFDDGKRYPLTLESCKTDPDGQPVVNTTWGLNCFDANETLTLPNEMIDNFTVEDIPLSPMAINNGIVWLMDRGKKRRIVSPVTVESFGGWSRAKWMQDYHMLQPEGKLLFLTGSVVKFNGNDAVYLTKDDALYRVPGLDELSAWRLSNSTTYGLPASANTPDPLPIVGALGFCATDVTTQTSYLLRLDGKKSILHKDKHYWPFLETTCLNVPSSLVSAIPSAQMTTVYRSTNGNIFTTGYGVKYVFATPDDFKQLGNDPSQIMAVSDAVDAGLSYGGLNLAEGRLFKVFNDDQIRLVKNGTSLAVNSSSYTSLPYAQLIIVDEITGNRYPQTGVYQP